MKPKKALCCSVCKRKFWSRLHLQRHLHQSHRSRHSADRDRKSRIPNVTNASNSAIDNAASHATPSAARAAAIASADKPSRATAEDDCDANLWELNWRTATRTEATAIHSPSSTVILPRVTFLLPVTYLSSSNPMETRREICTQSSLHFDRHLRTLATQQRNFCHFVPPTNIRLAKRKGNTSFRSEWSVAPPGSRPSTKQFANAAAFDTYLNKARKRHVRGEEWRSALIRRELGLNDNGVFCYSIGT